MWTSVEKQTSFTSTLFKPLYVLLSAKSLQRASIFSNIQLYVNEVQFFVSNVDKNNNPWKKIANSIRLQRTWNNAQKLPGKKSKQNEIWLETFQYGATVSHFIYTTITRYRIAFRSSAKRHLSDTECTTFKSWAKQHLSVAIISLK